MRIRCSVILVCAALALPASAVQASDGGSSGAAHDCQQGGWEDWVRREDGTTFATVGECVSYAAHGGTLTVRYAPAASACEALGGEFGIGGPDLLSVNGRVLWVCNGWTTDVPGDVPSSLVVICVNQDGGALTFNFGNGHPSTCFVPIFP